MSRIREILRKEDGVTILEFAIVAPVLFLLIFGIIEYGIVMATQSSLEASVNKTARVYKALAQTGGPTTESDNIDTIRRSILETSGDLIKDPSKLRVYANLLGQDGNGWGNAQGVNSAAYGEGAGNNNYQSKASAVASGKAGAADCRSATYNTAIARSCSWFASDVVQYQVYYDYDFMTPLLKEIKPTITLSASVVIQNEPDIRSE